MKTREVLLTILCVLAISVATPAAAATAQVPALPHYFYGAVKIDNIDAPIGTSVEARVPGATIDSGNPFTITAPGKYGADPRITPNVPGLVVQGNIVEGATIEFFVNGVKANQTAPWHSGQFTRVDLTAGAQSPPAPVPPTIVTGGAGDITANSASLFATLTNLGTAASVSVRFEYGTTTSYGSITPAQVLNQAVTFSAPVASLLPGTLYHFRAKADGGTSGLAVGADATFTTPVPGKVAPTVLTDNASGITANSVTLNGNLTALGTATSANVSFDWGTSTGVYSATTPIQARAGVGTFNASLSGLSANTTYYFRARAEAGIHGTGFGTEKSFTTLPGSSGASGGTGSGSGGGGGGGGGGSGGGSSVGGSSNNSGSSGNNLSGKNVTLSGLTGDKQLVMDNTGKTLNDSKLSDAENRVTVSILAGTVMKNPSGSPLDGISLAAPASIPPAPPQNSVITAREFGPSGATFDPPIVLTLTYSQTDLPAGADESALVIAFWDGAQWMSLPTTVNANTRTLTAFVSHFTIFGILSSPAGTVPASPSSPPPSPAPAPSLPAGPSQPALSPEQASPQPTPATGAPNPQPASSPAGINWVMIAGIIALVGVAAIAAGFFLGRKTAKS